MHEHDCDHEYLTNPYLGLPIDAPADAGPDHAAMWRGVIHDLLTTVSFTYPGAPMPSANYLRAVTPSLVARIGPGDDDQGARAFAWELAQQLRDWAAHGLTYRQHDQSTCTCGQNHEFVDQAVNVFLESATAGRIAEAVGVLRAVHRGDPASPLDNLTAPIKRVTGFLALTMYSVVGDLVQFDLSDD